MGRFWNRLLYLAAALVVFHSIMNRQPDDQARRPPPIADRPAEQPARRTPPPAQDLPGPRGISVVELEAQRNSTGTAFAVADGWWMTARHVVDGCDHVGLITGPRQAVWAQRRLLHPNADLALLAADLSRPALALEARAGFARGEDGFALGYPQGRPGDVHARYMGNLRLRSTGRYRTEEVAAVWAEAERVPPNLPSLGGLSGGPMFDRGGNVIGVLVASSKRRGRVITVLPATMLALTGSHSVATRSGRGPSLAVGNFNQQASIMRRDLRIAKVYCRVKGSGRRGRTW